MSSDPFNSLGGYTVGIPAIQVVDSNGNVVSNFLNLTGNVAAGAIYSNNYRFANGQPFAPSAAGSNTQLQFNNNGLFGGIPNVVWNGNILSLGNISNLSIGGGDNGYFLQTDGTGNLTWAAGGNGGGNGSPGGSNTQVQYNDAGAFGGDSGFTYNSSTNILTVGNISTTTTTSNNVVVNSNLTVNTSAVLNVTGNINSTTSANVTLGNVANIHITGGFSGYVLSTDGAGNLSWTAGGGGGNGSPGGTNQAVQFNDAGAFGGDIGFTYDSATNILSVPSIKSNATANFQGATNVNLGNVANLHISGGLNGYVLQTDGSGNLAWSASGGGGNGIPGGANTQVQFNNDGTFGGSAFLTYNDYTKVLQIGGNLIANSFQMGAGVYKWSTSLVYFATTASSTPAQVLYSIPIADVSGVEFEIIATEPAGPSRQSCKISSLYYNGIVQFTEYASLFVNGGVGNFEVDYNAGNIIIPPALELMVTPNSSNPITYKMLITVYAV
jgi:hypothetical protein